jgi:hypothetical protein
MNKPLATLDYLVETENPKALDQTVNQMSAAVVQDTSTEDGYKRVDGHCVLRALGNPEYVKFACEQQGYCKIVGELDPHGNAVMYAPPDVPTEMDEVYDIIATEFAKEIDKIFASEETLKAAFEHCFKHMEFTRTEHWSGILYKILDTCWREHGPNANASITPADRMEILRALLDKLDFNIYSQVALNLQDWSVLHYDGGNVQDQIDKIVKKWEKYSVTPLSKGAKLILNAWQPQDLDFNKDLGTVKSLKTISGIAPGISFRVSPKGSTPAFADSQNFSMIGSGGDRYVKVKYPELRIWYVTWKPGSTPPAAKPQPDGTFSVEGINYPFHSKSGGSVLNEAIFSRGVAFSFWSGLYTGSEDGASILVLPRMNSVMVVAANYQLVYDIFNILKTEYPMLELVDGERK